MRQRLALFAAALWWGSLTAVGFIVVPLLFKHLPSPAMAGQMAAHLFEAQTMISIAASVCLFLALRPKDAENQEKQAQAAIIFVILGLLLSLLAQYGVAPRIVARENLKLWHGVGSAMYLVQWLCAGGVLWKVGK